MAFNFKKALALSLSAAMVLTAAPVSGLDVQAASVKKVTVKVGATKKVTLKKKATKSTIKYAKAAQKKVVKVTYAKKTGKVSFKGLKAGSATVTVKLTVNKKTVTQKYKVTVKKANVAVKGVALSNTTPKVGDTIAATLEPTDASNVASYSWLVDGVEAGTAASFKVAEGSEGKTIQVVITDNAGNKFESDKVVVSVAAAKLMDASGLQTDGTGMIDDTLRVTYTADLGNPSQVTWYRDGTAIQTQTAQAAAGLTFETAAGLTSLPGNYYATITTGDGKNFTSNSIKLTNEEIRGVMSDYTITDYTDEYSYMVGAVQTNYQDFATKDGKAVITVKFNKYYDGSLYAFADNAGAFAAADSKQSWNLETLTGAKISVTSLSKLTDKAAIEDGTGIYYTDVNDGTITYKLVASNVTAPKGLVRGSSYKLVFDQKGIKDDDATSTNKNVNITSDAKEVPYLPAPAAIKVTGVTSNISAKVVVYGDKEMTKPLAFLGDANGRIVDGTAKNNSNLTIKAFVVEGNEAKDGAPMANASVDLKGGETDEFTVGYTAAKTGIYATLKTSSGIYGKNSISLTSELASLPANSASEVKTSYDKKKPGSIKVEFKGLKTSGKVYIVRTDKGNGTNITEAQITEDVGNFDAEDPSTFVGSADVEKNASSVVVDDVVDRIHTEYTGVNKLDVYSAVFVPTNNNDFGKATTTTDGAGTLNDNVKDTYCQVTPVATTFKLSGTLTGLQVAVSGTANATTAHVEAYDQFGDDMDCPAYLGGAVPTGVGKLNGVNASSEDQTLKAGIAAAALGNSYGIISFVTTNNGINAQKDDTYTVKVEDGVFLKFECTKAGAAGTAEWEVSLTDKSN